MRVTRHQHHKQILFDYSLHNQTLENVQSAKYLGITISDNMDWGQHISEISSKATKTLGFLRQGRRRLLESGTAIERRRRLPCAEGTSGGEHERGTSAFP